MDPKELTYLEEEKSYIIPEGVRPVLKTFRIEVTHKQTLKPFVFYDWRFDLTDLTVLMF